MDIMNNFTRGHDFFEHDPHELNDCDHPQCQSLDSAFSCSSPCPSKDEHLESSSHHGYCKSYKDDCVPVIFDRRYNFADRELCSRHFSVRLGGLRHKMAAVLRSYIGCKVVIGSECDGKVKKVNGRISFVGTDFVELVIHKKNKDNKNDSKKKYRMIPFDTINWFEQDEGNNA